MAHPKAYEPQQGYMYQILCKPITEREWEHCDYAETKADCNHLTKNYKEAYGPGFQFRVIPLPQKYWNMTLHRIENLEQRIKRCLKFGNEIQAAALTSEVNRLKGEI